MSSVFIGYIVPTIHVVSCLFLIVVVLLQTGKGADMGAVFGGGSQTLFGSGGAGNLLTKLTTGTAIAFMLTSLMLTYGQSRSPSTGLIDRLPPPATEMPATAPTPDAAIPAPNAGDAAAPAPGAAAEAPPVAANDATAPVAPAAPAAEAPAPAAEAPAPTPAPAPAPAP